MSTSRPWARSAIAAVKPPIPEPMTAIRGPADVLMVLPSRRLGSDYSDGRLSDGDDLQGTACGVPASRGGDQGTVADHRGHRGGGDERDPDQAGDHVGHLVADADQQDQ